MSTETTYRVEYLNDRGFWKIWSCYAHLATARNRVARLNRPARVIQLNHVYLP